MSFIDFKSPWILFLVTNYFILNRGTCETNSTGSQALCIGQSVALNCDCKIDENSRWLFGGNTLYVGDRLILSNPFGTLNLLPNYSLNISSVKFENEGIYQCICNLTVQNDYEIIVQAPPELSVFVNSTNDNDGIYYFEAGKVYSIFCYGKGARPLVNLTWIISDTDIDLSYVDSNVTENLTDAIPYDAWTRLTFQTHEEIGSIICVSNGDQCISEGQKKRVPFKTYVSPNVSLTIVGLRHGYVEENRTLVANCTAKAARPAANLTLLVNGEPVENAETLTHVISDFNLFDTSTIGTFYPVTEHVEVTCKSRGEYGYNEKALTTNFSTYSIPTLILTLNGTHIVNGSKYYINSGNWVLLTCQAFGARPAVYLNWTITGEVLDMHTKDNAGQSIVSEISLYLLPGRGKLTITCVSSCDLAIPKQNYRIEIFTKDIPSGFIRDLVFVIAACLLGLMLIIYFVVKFSVGTFNFKSRKKDFPLTQSVPLAERQTTKAVQSRESNMSSYIPEDATSPSSTTPSIMTVTAELHQEHDRRPPAMDLPSLPESSASSSYSFVSSEECIYYSETNNTSRSGQVLQQQDVSLITKLSSGLLYNRWMGTLETGNNQTNYVVVTTISDKTIQERKFHWNDFVKRVLELPQSDYIIKTKGIYIDAGHLYMVQEHIHCQTLEAYQTSRRQTPNSKYGTTSFSESDSMRLILEILNGMELIQSYGFLHPGLSTSKILLKGRGKCKLYDFCLAVDATNKVMCIKSKMDCSLNDLPLESMLRNEYTHESDIWSTAVVIWKILSSGSSPFGQFQYSQSEILAEVSRAWPDQAARIRNNLLFECWNKVTSLRPTILQVKSTFKEVWESLPKDTTTSQATSEDYMPMVGKVDGETQYSREILKTS